MKRLLVHPAMIEMYPGLLFAAVILIGLIEGWGK